MSKTRYIRYDAYFGTETEITKAQYKRKIKSKYMCRVWDDYWQRFYDVWFDSRDSIHRIFYWESEVTENDG